MAGIWRYNGDAWVQIHNVYRGTGTGYTPITNISRQMGEDDEDDWLAIWERPGTPPPPPSITVQMVTKTRNQFNVTVQTPDAVGDRKYQRVVVKVGIGETPNPPTVDDGMYYTQTDGSEPWSEWFTDQWRDYRYIKENSSNTKTFPSVFQSNVSLPLNTQITFSAWVMDEYGNWSIAATVVTRTLKSTDLPYGGVVYRTAINPYTWDSWSAAYNNWLYAGKMSGGKRVYFESRSWQRSAANPYYWALQGGDYQYRTFMWFGNNLRAVVNAAYEVKSVTMKMLRQYNTAQNKSGGKIVNDANTFGPRTGQVFSLWAHTSQEFNRDALGSTTDGSSVIITNSNSKINTSNFTPGATTTITIPKATWQHFLNGNGGKGKGLVFMHNGTTTGSSTDRYSVCFALPANRYGDLKPDKPDTTGMVVVEWVGFDGNPWPQADPSHPNFKPIGASAAW